MSLYDGYRLLLFTYKFCVFCYAHKDQKQFATITGTIGSAVDGYINSESGDPKVREKFESIAKNGVENKEVVKGIRAVFDAVDIFNNCNLERDVYMQNRIEKQKASGILVVGHRHLANLEKLFKASCERLRTPSAQPVLPGAATP